jgi:virulence-associated protein VapD
MSVTPIRRTPPPRQRIEQKASRMYAIAFDLNCEIAERLLGPNWRGCYQQIGRVLNEFGFQGQQGSLYFGQPGSSPVTCVTAIQEVDRRYPWFGRTVKDLRMLRIEEENDLMPALSTRLRFDDDEAAA